jgi:hypothetical protein
VPKAVNSNGMFLDFFEVVELVELLADIAVLEAFLLFFLDPELPAVVPDIESVASDIDEDAATVGLLK